jgi:LysR family transcriptional activator of nhaA
MFNFNHLYYFYTVARLGGVIHAAKYLRVAQPSLSTQLKVLEGHVDRALFKKVGRGLVLTRDGEIMYSICRKMFEPVDDLTDFLGNKESRVQKRARIGVADELERPFLVHLVRKIFRKEIMNQNMQVSMKSDKHRVLLDALRNEDLDVLLSNHAAHGEDFSILSEIAMPVRAVVSPNVMHLPKRKQLRESLAKTLMNLDAGLVLPMEEHKLRIETEIYLQKSRIRQSLVFESDILSAVVRAAVEGMGVAFLPKPYIANELKSGMLIDLSEGHKLWSHGIYQIVLKKRQIDLLNSEIRDYLRLHQV